MFLSFFETIFPQGWCHQWITFALIFRNAHNIDPSTPLSTCYRTFYYLLSRALGVSLSESISYTGFGQMLNSHYRSSSMADGFNRQALRQTFDHNNQASIFFFFSRHALLLPHLFVEFLHLNEDQKGILGKKSIKNMKAAQMVMAVASSPSQDVWSAKEAVHTGSFLGYSMQIVSLS